VGARPPFTKTSYFSNCTGFKAKKRSGKSPFPFSRGEDAKPDESKPNLIAGPTWVLIRGLSEDGEWKEPRVGEELRKSERGEKGLGGAVVGGGTPLTPVRTGQRTRRRGGEGRGREVGTAEDEEEGTEKERGRLGGATPRISLTPRGTGRCSYGKPIYRAERAPPFLPASKSL
jgi:hypothetical protein